MASIFLLLLSCILWLAQANRSIESPPPLPVLPIPSASQLHWQKRERALFMHFGINTFTDSEWGSGKEDPRLFFPEKLNARQWVSVAKEAGFNLIILTAKHHDGFCLWPSKYTNYSLASSYWKSGAGDVVQELSEAASEAGVELGLYLSPWDRHEESYGQTIGYNEHYLAQVRELLTNYGTISEFWLDGAKGSNVSMEYKFDAWFQTISQLQPGTVIFSDAGPGTRWVGDEQGQAGTTCWSMVQRNNIDIGNSGPILQYLNQGDEYGPDWVPPECDVSIRTGWFWHKNERPKHLWTLLDLYFQSVGRNCVLLLNVPPNSTGLISDEDSAALLAFNNALSSIFSTNLASPSAVVTASSVFGSNYTPEQVLSGDIFSFWGAQEGQSTGWLTLDLGKPTVFNVVQIQEPIAFGQRVSSHKIEAYSRSRGWFTLVEGTTIGYKKLHRIPMLSRAQVVRLVILESRAAPVLIASFGLYLDPYPRPHNTSIP